MVAASLTKLLLACQFMLISCHGLCRCHMHAFSLLIGSLLGHEYARKVIGRATRLITHIRASHAPLAEVRRIAGALSIAASLKSPNKTRFTSVQVALQSVVDLSAPLKVSLCCLLLWARRMLHAGHDSQAVLLAHIQAVARNGFLSGARAQDVKATIEDETFWTKADFLCKLLKPFSEAVMAMQSRKSTLADVTRYLLYLAKTLITPGLPWDQGEHAWCFNLQHLQWSVTW